MRGNELVEGVLKEWESIESSEGYCKRKGYSLW